VSHFKFSAIQKQSMFCSHFQKENIFDAALPFHYLTKLFGLGFYDFWTFKASIIDHLFVAAFSLCWLFFVYTFIEDRSQAAHYSSSNFLSKFGFVQFTMQCVCTILLILFNHFKRHHLKKILAYLNQFDEDLKNLGWTHQTNESSCTYMIFVIAWMSIVLGLAFLLGAENTQRHLINITLMYNFTFFIVIATNFLLAVLAIYRRLKSLIFNVQ
jgi:hypothetical protein